MGASSGIAKVPLADRASAWFIEPAFGLQLKTDASKTARRLCAAIVAEADLP
jgi:hypothetical protein